MFEIVFPIPFLVMGILMTFWRDKAAHGFCELGKAIWLTQTLGWFDMARFYQEEKARKTFRLLGPIFLLAGLLLSGMTYLSFSGPGMFCAMRESRAFLASRYGPSGTWKVSSRPAGADDSVDLSYRYGDRTGRLHATWQKDHYTFAELPGRLPAQDVTH